MAFLDEKYKTRKYLLGNTDNSLILILSLCLLGFCAVNLIKAAHHLGSYGEFNYYTDVLPKLILDGNLYAIVQKPWTLFTYMFVNDSNGFSAGIMMAGNMLWFWLFGYIYQNVAGNEHVFPVFVYGGILGGLMYLVSGALFSHTAIIEMGGGIPVAALAVATLVASPKCKLLSELNGGIPLWFFVVAYFAVSIGVKVGVNNALVAAYIVSGMIGLLYGMFLKTGTDLGSWMGRFYTKAITVFEPKDGVEAKNYTEQNVPAGVVQKVMLSNSKELFIDEIIEKIQLHGRESLTAEEQQHLQKSLS